MTLLTASQAVARRCQLKAPSAIIGSGDDTAKVLLACAQDEGEALSRRHPWTKLIREHAGVTVDATTDYALPTDFGRLIDGTIWNRDQYTQLRGPLSPSQWQVFKSSQLGQSAALQQRWRIKYSTVSSANRFFLDPTPSAAEDFVFEYVSSQWCQSSGGTGQATWTADSDVFRLDEWLLRLGMRWRLLETTGFSYVEARDEYERECDRAISQDGGAPVLGLIPERGIHLLSPCDVPDTGFGEAL